MEHALISTIITSIVTAFIFGILAKKIKLPAIFGYLIAGILIGPNTPGFVADISLAKQLAEIGIILLMFGVGLHFSLQDLLNNRNIAIFGAFIQMVCITIIGGAFAMIMGSNISESVIFGFSLSVASTVVLIRSLEQHNLLYSVSGKISVSWLIVEDIAMVFALVTLPVIAEIVNGTQEPSSAFIFITLLTVLIKIGCFFAFMFIVGRRFLPWLLIEIAKVRSPELNTLGILAIALGFSLFAYLVFDASLALGAFLAGVTLGETEIGRQSAETTLPMRDTFSVLFFVSVGMLFNPFSLITHPISILVTFLIIVFVKALLAFMIVNWFKKPKQVSSAVAIGLSQIGEFSFILGGLALTNRLISEDLYDLILAGAMLSIVVNPFLFRIYDKKRTKSSLQVN